MNGFAKKLLSSILACALMLSLSAITVFASEPISVSATVQEAVDESGMNATVTDLSQSEYDALWTSKIAQQESVTNFFNKAIADGYRMAPGQNGAAIKVTDDLQARNSVYMMSKALQNDNDETLVVMFIYNPQTNSILRAYAEKVGTDNVASLYYEYEDLVKWSACQDRESKFLSGLTRRFRLPGNSSVS